MLSVKEKLQSVDVSQFVKDAYQAFAEQNTNVQDYFANNGDADKEAPCPRAAVSTISSRMQARDKEILTEFEYPFEHKNFSYDLTESEENQIKYGNFAPSVRGDRSYRIAAGDDEFSNIPFLVYIVCGAPLSGKTTMCRKIQSQFSVNGKTIPIVKIDEVLGNSEVYAREKKAQEEMELAMQNEKKKQKNAAPIDPLGFMKTEQYIIDLAGEFVDKVNNMFKVSEEQFLKIGMIIDSLESKYVLSVADYELFFKSIMS